MTQLRQTLDPKRTGQEAGDLGRWLSASIVGQQKAIDQIVNAYQKYQTGLSAAGRPIANFLFLGPTGTGKTRLVEATAEALVGTAKAVVKIDCGELQHSHEIAKLVGSPPGYIGHRETTPRLSQEALNQHHTENVKISFVLFDEIEKASDALWNLLLCILDRGTLTLGDGRRVDFSHAMIFMTSNLGAAEMSNLVRPKFGFAGTGAASDANGALGRKVRATGVEAARRRFSPEFLNRLDEVVVFESLGDAELRRIVEMEVRAVEERVRHAAGGEAYSFEISESAKLQLLAEGTDTRYGARHLKRAIDRLLVQPVANLIATGQVRAGDVVHVDGAAGQALVFWKQVERQPSRPVLARAA